MDRAFHGLIGGHCFVYIDDIVTFGNTIQEYNHNLELVLQRITDLGLKLGPTKCEYLKPELEYLALTQKETPFNWTSNCEKAFQTLKNALTSAPVLRFPDFKKKFILTTDAFNYGLGAVLSQEGHQCLFISRTLNKAEENYTTSQKELLAIVWAVKRLRQYLLGKKFPIQTDHKALIWLHNVKDPSSRLLRWRLRLEEYVYEIEYVKGKENKVADCLSRLFPIQEKDVGQIFAITKDSLQRAMKSAGIPNEKAEEENLEELLPELEIFDTPMKVSLSLLTMITLVKAQVRIEPLTTNLYKEKLGLATIYEEQWILIIGINLTNTHERIYNINKLKDFLVQNYDNTLSQNDIDQVDYEFDQVYSNNKKVAEIVKNNTKIIKLILDGSSQDMQSLNGRLMAESQLMKQLVNSSNENRKQLLLQNKITTLEIFISEMSEDLSTALNAINIGKHGMMEPTIVTPAILKSTIQEFETQYQTRYHFEGQETNYQRIIDSADINILTKKDCVYINDAVSLDQSVWESLELTHKDTILVRNTAVAIWGEHLKNKCLDMKAQAREAGHRDHSASRRN
ncbi:uncharacterized protein LOC117181286 [Belonocnema kinseyi]|uniref:uncharacterized protein LOC117181286 n=1 Tax=Belonocnema kinseyi TaxID=2817044 RepID=UPI00143DB48D|nr:uncharacterized protein LOC117181286 [Belonocnema kinseyi]